MRRSRILLFVGAVFGLTSGLTANTAYAGKCDPTVLTHGVEACKDSCLCAPAFQSGCEKQCNGLSEPVKNPGKNPVKKSWHKCPPVKAGRVYVSDKAWKRTWKTKCDGPRWEEADDDCVAPEVRMEDGNCGEPVIEPVIEPECLPLTSCEWQAILFGNPYDDEDEGHVGLLKKVMTAVKAVDCATPAQVKAVSKTTGNGDDDDLKDWPLFAGLGLIMLISIIRREQLERKKQA